VPSATPFNKFKGTKNTEQFGVLCMSKPISRVLYLMVIYLGYASLHTSSHFLGRRRAALTFHYRCCSRRGLQSRQVTMPLVSSYLTFPPLSDTCYSTRRFISVALSLELPPPGVTRHPALGARTFLRYNPWVVPATIWLTHHIFYADFQAKSMP